MPVTPGREPGAKWYSEPDPTIYPKGVVVHRTGKSRTLPRARIRQAFRDGVPLSEIPAAARVPASYLRLCLEDPAFEAKLRRDRPNLSLHNLDIYPIDEALAILEQAEADGRIARILPREPGLHRSGGGMGGADMRETVV